MALSQTKKMLISKKENVVRFNNPNQEVCSLLNLSTEDYNNLSDEDKLSKLDAIIKENSWKGRRITKEKKEKIDIENNSKILMDILENGTEEEKKTLFDVINGHKKVLQIKDLEEKLANKEREIEQTKAEIEALKRM
jgi:hypothetical protein